MQCRLIIEQRLLLLDLLIMLSNSRWLLDLLNLNKLLFVQFSWFKEEIWSLTWIRMRVKPLAKNFWVTLKSFVKVLKLNVEIDSTGRSLATHIKFSTKKENFVTWLRFLIQLRKVILKLILNFYNSFSLFMGQWRKICF